MAKKYVLDIWDCLFNATDYFEDYVLGINPTYIFNPDVLERQTSDSYLFEFFARALSNRNCDNLVFDLGNLSRHEHDTLRALSREAVPRKRLPQETAETQYRRPFRRFRQGKHRHRCRHFYELIFLFRL